MNPWMVLGWIAVAFGGFLALVLTAIIIYAIIVVIANEVKEKRVEKEIQAEVEQWRTTPS